MLARWRGLSIRTKAYSKTESFHVVIVAVMFLFVLRVFFPSDMQLQFILFGTALILTLPILYIWVYLFVIIGFAVKSIQRLFPCDQSMVVVIDDRGDVWHWSPNLIRIQPCKRHEWPIIVFFPPGASC